MNFYIDKIQKFFNSVAKYFSNTGYAFSWLFIIFVGLFALTTLVIIVASQFSYECVLTRALDKINKFLSKNPRINEDNLITFNNKMKDKSVPKALRRQWQQFMIYREHDASYYMSFKHCVENPLKSNSFNQQMQIYKVSSFILIFLSILLGIFCTYQTSFVMVLQDVLIIPIFILVLYWLVSMVLNLIHSATTGDLYQNYQYFEINIDKATVTLPEYVDYEVLFTQEEIKKGIPVLFEYIQRRALEEQKELEKARIKNVEHEKFNFDKSGIEASLVLERSMQEAENYIATRKKYMADIEAVNNEISALENQHRENVKENQRMMQTSKETVDGLKQQLDQATSSIEINYIKKQIKDELNRQQVAERDFDAVNERYNKDVKSLNDQISDIQGEIDKAKNALETSMMSEFGTYSSKVYKKLEESVKEKNAELISGYKKEIFDLEEKLSQKDEELDNVYSQYKSQLSQLQEQSKQYEERSRQLDSILEEKDNIISSVQSQLEEGKSLKKSKKNKKNKGKDEPVNETNETAQFEENPFDDSNNFDPLEDKEENPFDEQDNPKFDYDENPEDEDAGETVQPDPSDWDNKNDLDEGNDLLSSKDFDDLFNENKQDDLSNNEFNYTDESAESSDNDNEEKEDEFNYTDEDENKDAANEESDSELKFNYTDEDNEKKDESEEKFDYTDENADESNSNEEEKSEKSDDSDLADEEYLNSLFANIGMPESAESQETHEENDAKNEEENKVEKPVKKAGRPRKIIDENDIRPKRPVGRPKKKKKVQEGEGTGAVAVKRKAGRPRKQTKTETNENQNSTSAEIKSEEVAESVQTESTKKPARRVGRPKKQIVKRVGRPKKQEIKRVGRPKKEEIKKVGRPKKSRVGRPKKVRSVGRPRKGNNDMTDHSQNLNAIDKKLKKLNEQIKKENQNLRKTKKQLEKVSLNKNKK